MLSTTVAFPLSAGRIVGFLLSFRVLSAALSVFVKLSLGSDQSPDDAVYSLLQKGLNFVVTPRSTPIEDNLAVVGKAVLSLPVEMAEEARQETVRIIKSAPPSRDNLTKNREGSTQDPKREQESHYSTSRQRKCYSGT